MFNNKKLIDYLIKENSRLTNEIIGIRNKMIDDIKKDADGRVKLAMLANRSIVAKPEEIENTIMGYLKLGWESKEGE